jgi:hypothetical protein
VWTTENFWQADCRCGNYHPDKLAAMAHERDRLLDALEEALKWKHAYQNEIDRIGGNHCECSEPHQEGEHG